MSIAQSNILSFDMSRNPEVDPHGKPAVIVSIRFASDIIQMLDLLADNRSKFVRDATYEKIAREMEDGQKNI
jgi:hypothetical protein